MPVWGWRTPATDIPEQYLGTFRIVKRDVKMGTAWPMCRTFGYDYCIFMNDTKLTILQEKRGGEWRDWMVDSPYDWYAMGEFALRTQASNVLVGGLGLSLILHHLFLRRDIAKITVVELNKEIIDLVSSYIPKDDRVEIVHGDFLKVVPELASKDKKYDTVIMDMWTGEDRECVDLFNKAFEVVSNFYPSSINLFHSFQRLIDTEIVNTHFKTGLDGPLRFIPEDLSRAALQRRQSTQ